MRYKNPNYVKEAVIQSELFTACKKAGLRCDMQYVICPGEKENQCTFDLVVVESYDIIAIVEVKTSTSINASVEDSSQIRKYRKQNVPVFILYSIYDIPYLVKQLVEVKTKFLESVDSDKAKCFEVDRQNIEKWNTKITAAFIEFDETFPDYKFTNDHSLELLAIGVRVLGLTDILKLMDEHNDNLKVFFSMLDAQINYRNTGRDRFLNTRKGTTHSISSYYTRQDHIDEKLK